MPKQTARILGSTSLEKHHKPLKENTTNYAARDAPTEGFNETNVCLNKEAHLGTSIIKDARLWLVCLDRCYIDDSAALVHVLNCILRYGEVGKDVCVECALQTLPPNLLKLVNLLVLEGSIVDQDVNATPLLDGLIHNVPK